MILSITYFVVLFVDQVSKALALSLLPFFSPRPFLGNIIFLTLTRNKGAAFGMFPAASVLLLILSTSVVLGIFYFSKKIGKLPVLYQIAIAMVIGGASGNLLDRLTYGVVVDFIDFRIWPVFNFGDSAIVIGGILLGFLLLFSRQWK
jgi:signal peptidase II